MKKPHAGGNREQGKESSNLLNDTISTVAIESIFPSLENDDVSEHLAETSIGGGNA